MPLQCAHALAAENVPDLDMSANPTAIAGATTYLALKVIVTGKQQTTRDGEGDRGDATYRLGNLFTSALVMAKANKRHSGRLTV